MSVLYIPGLGKGRTITAQRAIVSAYNLFRKDKIAFFHPLWHSDEPYGDKFERLVETIKAVRPNKVWGISAGASLAVRLCVEYLPDSEAHLVCGKVYNPKNIGARYRNEAPAFVESVEYSTRLAEKLDPFLTHCYIPANNADGVIDSRDMMIEGASQHNLPKLKHARAISYALFRHLPGL